MSNVAYHSKRAMQEFHAGMTAPPGAAAQAHLRLSSMHMSLVNALEREPQAGRHDDTDRAAGGRMRA